MMHTHSSMQGLLFPFFGWTSKRTGVPVIGTLITGAFTATLALFMSLNSLADAISIGTLLAFNLVNSGVMIVRYSRPDHYPLVPVGLVAAYVVTCLLSAIGYVRGLHIAVPIVFAALAVITFIQLCVFHLWCKNQNIPETFKCPLVPLVPCIGIAINSYMLAGLEAMAWIRLVAWLLIGLVIYFCYGIRFSRMRLYNEKKDLGVVN